MASRRPRPSATGALGYKYRNHMEETLTRLGITPEQFQAKQTELVNGLLQNEPFVPTTTSNNRHLALYEKVKFGGLSSNRSRSSSLSSESSRAPSPTLPRTPMKADSSIPPRPRDQMEMVIESRNKLKATQRRDSTSRSREDGRVISIPDDPVTFSPSVNQLPPGTPHHYKYYSERVVGSASSSKVTLDAGGIPETPSRGRDKSRFKAPLPRGSLPKTPSRRPRPSSTPLTPRSSSPPMVNLVSSPGPMQPTPPAEEHLPFALPSGPYSSVKPDLSYAAMIGRAILASPNHALALQDIYEYITTVFPHYKRGEPTWMNSVRHALSTMAVFRKVTRGRAEGKSLWAIHDCDIPCFDGGGFKKALCADMTNPTSGPKGSRKRQAEDGGGSRSKRKKAGDDTPALAMPAPMLPSYYPPFANTNPHHQSYYQAAYMQQHAPTDSFFPPLPTTSNYHRVVARTVSIPTLETPSVPGTSTDGGTESEHEDSLIPPSSPITRPPSSSSLPDLDVVSALSTSSSPAPSTHASLRGETSREGSPAVVLDTFATMDLPVSGDDEDAIAAWLQSYSPLRPSTPVLCSARSKDKVKAAPSTPEPSAKKHLSAMLPPRTPSPTRRGRRSVVSSSTKDAIQSLHIGETPSSIHEHVSDIAEAIRTVQQAVNSRTRREQGSVSATAADQAFTHLEGICKERPTTPVRDQPTTPQLPSTPGRLEQLESELFNFSPYKSPAGDILTSVSQSPSLSIFNSRAPLLHMGSMDDLLASDALPTAFCTPGALPKTPKKSPFGTGGSVSTRIPRIASPMGTPSRTGPKGATSNQDDDISQFFQSPNYYSGMFSGLQGLGSPSNDRW